MPTMTESNRKLHGGVQTEARRNPYEILGETEEKEARRPGESKKVGGGEWEGLRPGVLSLYG